MEFDRGDCFLLIMIAMDFRWVDNQKENIHYENIHLHQLLKFQPGLFNDRKNMFLFPNELNGIWSCRLFFLLIMIATEFRWVHSQNVTTIVFHSIWKESLIYFAAAWKFFPFPDHIGARRHRSHRYIYSESW